MPSLFCLFNSATSTYPNVLPNPNPSQGQLSLGLLLTGPLALSFASSNSLSTQQSKRALKKLTRDYETWFSLLRQVKSGLITVASVALYPLPSSHSLCSTRTASACLVLFFGHTVQLTRS